MGQNSQTEKGIKDLALPSLRLYQFFSFDTVNLIIMY